MKSLKGGWVFMQMDYKLSKKINVINQLCTETYFETKITSKFNLSGG